MKNIIAFTNGLKSPIPFSLGGNEPIPTIPANLTSNSTEPYNSNLQWDPSSGRPWGYKIKIDDVEYISTFETEIEILNLGGGNEYDFYVKAFNGFGESDWANTNQLTLPGATADIDKYFINNQIHIEWNAVGGATSYKIYSDSQLLGTTSNLTIDIDGREYYSLSNIYVVAVNDTGDSTMCKIVMTNWNRPPMPTYIKIVDFTTTSISLKWNDMEIDHYKVYVNGSYNSQVDTNEATLSLVADTVYDIKITSYDGVYESCYSHSLLIYTKSPPANVRAENVTKTSMDILWDEDVEADSYNVYLNRNFHANTTNLTLSFSDMEEDFLYTIWVSSVVTDHETTKAIIEIPTLMGSPENLYASEIGNDYLVLGWDKLNTVDHYKVAIDNSYTIDEITENYYTITMLTPNTDYLFKVKGLNLSGEGDESDNISVSTRIDTPENLSISVTDDGVDNSVLIDWDPVSGADNYKLYLNHGNTSDEYETTNDFYSITSLTRNELYQLMIMAFSSNFESQVLTREFTIYEKPMDFRIAGISSNELLLQWMNNDYAEKYEILCNVTNFITENSSFEINTLSADESFIVKVRAINLDEMAFGPYSDEINIKTLKLFGGKKISYLSNTDNAYFGWEEDTAVHHYTLIIGGNTYTNITDDYKILPRGTGGDFTITGYNESEEVIKTVTDVLPIYVYITNLVGNAYEDGINATASVSDSSGLSVRWYLNNQLVLTNESLTYHFDNLEVGGRGYTIGVNIKKATGGMWGERMEKIVTTNPAFTQILLDADNQNYFSITWEVAGYNYNNGFDISGWSNTLYTNTFTYNVESDKIMTVTGNGSVATVTLTDLYGFHDLIVGQWAEIKGTSHFNGYYQVTQIVTTKIYKINHTYVGGPEVGTSMAVKDPEFFSWIPTVSFHMVPSGTYPEKTINTSIKMKRPDSSIPVSNIITVNTFNQTTFNPPSFSNTIKYLYIDGIQQGSFTIIDLPAGDHIAEVFYNSSYLEYQSIGYIRRYSGIFTVPEEPLDTNDWSL